ncbi:MAG: MFS transporter [Candidatus Bathyarchaeia archaeon]
MGSSGPTARFAHALLLISWFAWFWNFAYRMMVPALLPPIQASLSIPNWMAGALVGALNFGYAISAYPSGLCSARFGPRNIIVFGTALSAAFAFLLSISTSYPAMAMLAFIAGLGLGVYLPQALTLLSEHYGRGRRGAIIGIHETAAPIGQMAGPLWAGAMLSSLGWDGCLRAWALPGALIAIAFPIIAPKREEAVKRVDKAPGGGGWPLGLYIPTVLLVSFVWSANLGLISMIPLYMVRSSLADAAFAAFLMGITRFSGALGQLAGGLLSDMIGRLKVLMAIVLITAFSTVGVAFAPYGPAMIASMLVQAMAGSAFFPVTYAAISDNTSPGDRAKVIGVVNTSSGLLGGALSPMVIGYLADSFGFKAAFLYPVVVGFLACPLALQLRIRLH